MGVTVVICPESSCSPPWYDILDYSQNVESLSEMTFGSIPDPRSTKYNIKLMSSRKKSETPWTITLDWPWSSPKLPWKPPPIAKKYQSAHQKNVTYLIPPGPSLWIIISMDYPWIPVDSPWLVHRNPWGHLWISMYYQWIIHGLSMVIFGSYTVIHGLLMGIQG